MPLQYLDLEYIDLIPEILPIKTVMDMCIFYDFFFIFFTLYMAYLLQRTSVSYASLISEVGEDGGSGP